MSANDPTRKNRAAALFLSYGLTLLLVAAAAVTRWGLEYALGPIPAFLTFYPALMVAALIGGLGPGLVATGLGGLTADYFFMPPVGSLRIMNLSDGVSLAVFLFVGAFISVITDRLRAARAGQVKREYEQRWATTLASIGDAVIATDVTGRITFMNPVAEGLTGWTLSDASMKPVTEVFNIVNEYTRNDVESPVAKVLRQGMIVGLANHTILKKKDGTEVPIDDSGAPVRDAGGRTTGVVLVFRDITERKQAEAALTQARVETELRMKELQAVLDVAPAAIWIAHDPECMRVTGNRYADEIAKVPIGTNTSATAPPGDAIVPWRMFRNGVELKPEELPAQKAAATGEPVDAGMVDLVFSDGRVMALVLAAVPLFDADGRVLGSVVAGADVTSLREAEKEVQESEERYRNLFDTMDEGFCVIEMIFDGSGRPSDYRFLKVNAAFEKQTGLHDAEGKLMRDLAPDHEAHWFEIYGKIALTGEALRFTNEARALNRWYDVYAYRVGKPEERQVAIVFHDISEVKRAEEALQKAHDELEERITERTEVLARQADLLELAYNAILVRDPGSRITFWNHRAEELYGWTKAEALGQVTHTLLQDPIPRALR